MKQNVLITLGILMQLASLTICQRVAPGVNPNHYQQQQYQPPPPQYQQQVPQQQQPQYHQQPPQQQQQQQQQPQYQQQQFQQHQQQQHQQQQHQQQQQQHGDHGQQQVLHTGNLQQEKQHIAEHMEVPIDTSKMSEQELQFHYFKMHDSDNNNKLDGCELIKSLIHWHDNKDEHHQDEEKPSDGPDESHNDGQPYDDATLQSLVDPIMEMMDKDHDGFITYTEYRQHEESGQTPQ
ncbi:putative cyclin-dependent serine/threonine-protein kinase DDB_G0272797/DDB_G0274007 isoform X2 [Anopheles funestus]|uniref:putative cyclin-dependent serine/threonine-protein kinase DDB_G0272797/DDB_G0274007 isoform X2 n=1 Tax=Anopheles funestus TaxID=62324 RepID=UPI0020C747C2|nr:putative cyclin-dependent serine/threonine-protein kinase DDB_G0272797/DDB_G0274007 isoform X2 [Anopheles funestus]